MVLVLKLVVLVLKLLELDLVLLELDLMLLELDFLGELARAEAARRAMSATFILVDRSAGCQIV